MTKGWLSNGLNAAEELQQFLSYLLRQRESQQIDINLAT